MDRKKLTSDLILATFANFLYKVVGYFVLSILTRYLSKGEMGEFFFAASLSTFFALFTQLGTDNYIIREAAGKPETALNKFSEVLSMRIILLTLFIMLLNGFTLIFRPEISEVVFLTSIYVLLEQTYSSFGAVFVGIKKVKFNVISGVISRILLVGLIVLIVRLNGTLAEIIGCYIAANAILVIVAYSNLYSHVGRPIIKWDQTRFKRIFRLSFPFFLLTLLSLVHFKIDSLMLGFLKPYSVVAEYESAYKLFEASQFLIVPIGMIFLPILSEMAVKNNWREMRDLINKILRIAALTGIFIFIVIAFGADVIIPFVFGSAYSGSAVILRILYLTVPFLYAVHVSILLTRAIYLEKKAIKAMLFCTLLNIVFNSIFIPAWGAIGAAWGTFLTETVLSILLIRINSQKLKSLITNPNLDFREPAPAKVFGHHA